MSNEAPKKRPWRRVAAVICTALGLLVLLAWFGVKLIQQPLGKNEVADILTNNRTNRAGAVDAILAMGPRAYPGLRELVEYRESPLHKRYRTNWWRSLSAGWKQTLPDPTLPRQLHMTAIQFLSDLGPAFVRPLTPSICKVGEDDDPITTLTALSLLYWSVPDSPEANARLSQWFSDPGAVTINFGSLGGLEDEFWSRVPKNATHLAGWLRIPGGVSTAVKALAVMGTNAAPAIPALIEVCDKGVASPVMIPKTNRPFALSGTVGINAILPQNRLAGINTLARIGITSPEVLTALNRMLTDTNESVRSSALYALSALKQPVGKNFAAFMADFSTRTNMPITEIFSWVRCLGSEDREALPWLQRLDSVEKIRAELPHLAAQPVQRPQPVQQVPAVAIQPAQIEMLRSFIVIAICRIDQDALARHLPVLVAQLGRMPAVAELLSGAKAQSAEIVAALEPILTNLPVAAYVVLGLQPDNEAARNAMRAQMENGALNARLNAANMWWKRTGDSSKLIDLCREGLEPKDGRSVFITPLMETALRNLGETARPLVPALKAALWHPNSIVRDSAGRILMKIAPEALPPVKP